MNYADELRNIKPNTAAMKVYAEVKPKFKEYAALYREQKYIYTIETQLFDEIKEYANADGLNLYISEGAISERGRISVTFDWSKPL